jgi:hypothetical protein
MGTGNTNCFYFLLLLLSLQVYSICAAQVADPDPEKWAMDLDRNGLRGNDSLQKIAATLQRIDSEKAFHFLDELQKKGTSKGDRFRVRFNCLRANVIYYWLAYYNFYQQRKSVDLERAKKQIMQLYSSAIDLAYRLEDNYLVAYASSSCGSVINNLGETGLAVMYTKNGIDMYEELDVPVQPQIYQYLAELLYKVREYNECIRYAKKAVITWRHSANEIKSFTVSCLNTVGLGYHRQKIYDSALIYYNQALQLAKQIKDTVWTGIVSGNMGQIFYAQQQFDTAYKLLTMDYNASKAKGYYDNAANSLQWAARTDLALGRKTAALKKVRESFQLLKMWPDGNYLRNTYYTATQVFREMSNYDSAFYYSNLWSVINDSLEKVVATSSLAISTAKLNDKTSRYNIQNLNKERRSQVLFRNIIISAIVVLFILVVLAISRQLLKEKLKSQKAEQEKLLMVQETALAKEQLLMFTENIIEKTNLIEKLESQVKGKETTSEQHVIITELSKKTILTEDDWNRFKSLFEKIYPAFFISLKQKFPDITLAEQRMAALIRLQLTSKLMASMLGISVDSVHKTRQRLRQRIRINPETNLEEVMINI